MNRASTFVALIACSSLCGCRQDAATFVADAHSPTAIDASVESTGLDAGDDTPDAAIAHAQLTLRLSIQSRDGGWSEPVSEPAIDVFEVDSVRAIELTIAPALVDYRVRTLDDGDRVIASDDLVAVLDGGLRYLSVFATPLTAGKRYSISVDAQAGSAVAGPAGAYFDDRTIGLRVNAIEPPAAATKTQPKKRRK